MTDRDQVERNARAAIAAFVPRARRVEAHSLAQDLDALLRLARMSFPVLIDRVNGTATMVQELPPEEQVESAAARVRPLILNNDPTFHAKFTNALGYFLRAADAPPELVEALRGLRAQWAAINPKDGGLRGYSLERSVAGSGVSERVTDNVLGFAWIYGDVVHSDAELLARTRSFGVVERFRAAVPLVAHIMMLTIATLNLTRVAHRHGLVSVEKELFCTPVIVTETSFRAEGKIYLAELRDDGEPVTAPPLGEELGQEWRPIHEVFGPSDAGAVPPDSGATG